MLARYRSRLRLQWSKLAHSDQHWQLQSCWRSQSRALRSGSKGSQTRAFITDQRRMNISRASVEGSFAPATQRCTFVDITGSMTEELSDLLLYAGAMSVSVDQYCPEGAQPQDIFAHNGQPPGEVWRRCLVHASFDSNTDISQAVSSIRTQLTIPAELNYTTAAIAEQNWVKAVEDSYQPMQVSSGLWIIPSWADIVDEHAVNIIMHPGLAFGTGEHATTQLCLRFLGARDLQGQDLIDYGTGSGVLGVAALKLGAASACATDVEPCAVHAAAENAGLNGVADRLQALQVPLSVHELGQVEALQGRQFDICIANILQGPLIQLAPFLASLVKPGGYIALAGILISQTEALRAAYQPYFANLKLTTQGEWALLEGVRKQ